MKVHDPPMQYASEGEGRWAEFIESNPPQTRGGYGYACCRFASEFATRMDQEMIADGVDQDVPAAVAKWIDAHAERISAEADNEGITGFMYGRAVRMIVECWRHGEIFRRWHNKETQIGTEGDEANKSGGILNPAIIVVGK